MRRLLILMVVLALGGCQLALPGKAVNGGEIAQGNPITGDVISVTSLAPPGAEGAPVAPVNPDGPASPEGAEIPEGSLEPDATAPVPDPETASEIQAAPAAKVEVKTPSHLACEKKGGRWSMAGSANASFCQTPTKDAGKSCGKEGDCAGYCLAKSRTCAPYTPLLGCNEILNAGGRAITQCIN